MHCALDPEIKGSNKSQWYKLKIIFFYSENQMRAFSVLSWFNQGVHGLAEVLPNEANCGSHSRKQLQEATSDGGPTIVIGAV